MSSDYDGDAISDTEWYYAEEQEIENGLNEEWPDFGIDED